MINCNPAHMIPRNVSVSTNLGSLLGTKKIKSRDCLSCLLLIPSAFIQLSNIVIRTGSFEGLINIYVCKLKNIELFST